jgi:uncharacterized OsmC-like protein
VAGDLLISRVRSYSSGTPGRALNQARTNHFVIDSSHEPEAVSTVESFLAGVSACGVTLVEGAARSEGLPLQRMEINIEGVRLPSESSVFKEVNMRFQLAGVSQEQAEQLIQTYRNR